MSRILSFGLIAALTANTSGQSKPDWQTKREACITTLSSLAVDPSVVKPPDLPEDLRDVSIEYTASGCLGTCPAFTLRIDRNKAIRDGHGFVKKKGKAEKRISGQEFTEIVHAWLDAKIYAMRDDYCEPICPDGSSHFGCAGDIANPRSAVILEDSLGVLHHNR